MSNQYLKMYLKNKNPKIVSKERHTYLTYKGLLDSYVYILQSGIIKTSVILKDGREFNLSYLNDVEIVTLMKDETSEVTTAPFNIRIESESASFYQINRIEFWKDVNVNQELLAYVKNYYRDNLNYFIHKCERMLMNGKKGALHAILLELADRFGVKTAEGLLIDFTITYEELAGFCGISSHTSVNRMITELRAKKVVEIVNRKILITDYSYLVDNVAR
ncbi:Crp/Fnr family transcriptional regulator [Ectobacillus polymachus]|uniref:Crp/Fnr family transcriptional regulator n=1 Tax=Ectobacillus polymachus TaxID=1508806 RepID=UPI003A83F819